MKLDILNKNCSLIRGLVLGHKFLLGFFLTLFHLFVDVVFNLKRNYFPFCV